MEQRALPPNYTTVMPYLIVKGAGSFSEFMQKIFGAEEIQRHLADDNTRIMHGELKIGDSLVMFADANDEWNAQNAGLYIHVANVDETYKKALEKGATSIYAPVQKEYGYTAGISDPYGNTWWLTQI